MKLGKPERGRGEAMPKVPKAGSAGRASRSTLPRNRLDRPPETSVFGEFFLLPILPIMYIYKSHFT